MATRNLVLLLLSASLASAPAGAAQSDLHEIDLVRPFASGDRYAIEGTGAMDMEIKISTLLILSFSKEESYQVDYSAEVTVEEVSPTGNPLRETHRIVRCRKLGTGLFGMGREDLLAPGVILTIDHREDRETFTVPGQPLDDEVREALDVHFGNRKADGYRVTYEADVSGEIAVGGAPAPEQHVIRVCEKHGFGFLGLGRKTLIEEGERLLVTREDGRVRFESQPRPPSDDAVAALAILFGGLSDPRTDAIFTPPAPQRVGATWPVDFSRIKSDQPEEIADVIDGAEGSATLQGIESPGGQRCLRLAGEWQVPELGKSIEIPENLDIEHALMRSSVRALYPVDRALQPLERVVEFRAEFDVGGQPEGDSGPEVRARGHVAQRTDLHYSPR